MSQSTNAILFYGYCWFDEDHDICKLDEFETHCSEACAMPFLAAWSETARRGNPEEIKKLPEIDKEWEPMLDKIIEDNDLEFPGDIGWWLVSYWEIY